ncbi:hypothetical protein DSM19430T_29810 [Desulfovibrio psychrotolerans]|uniref:Uncharacterized protein n=1 Tax=Desulfovibrio psychrotolerans TaxID=415242 RepID=A0A7J0BX67_9BACT|nr:hypothetical protein DSM19430T_29810 [Desulfovibrio psychrotolerans]
MSGNDFGKERGRANAMRKSARTVWGEVDSVLFCFLCPERNISGVPPCECMTCPNIVEEGKRKSPSVRGAKGRKGR